MASALGTFLFLFRRFGEIHQVSELSLQDLIFHFFDFPFGNIAEHKGAVTHADQAVHDKSKMFHGAADFTVFAFA